MTHVQHSKICSAGIVLVTLAVCAWFLARGASACVAMALPRSAPALTPLATAVAPPLGLDAPDRCAVLARNIFDSDTGALCPAPRPAAKPTPPPPPRPGELPPQCEGAALKLVAAVSSEREPEASFAQVVRGAAESLSLQPGERVDDHEVFAIYPTAVLLKQPTGHYCSLAMFGDPAPVPAVAATRPSDSGITAISETRFEVQRARVDQVLSEPQGLLRSIRAVPQTEDGNAVGVKLYGIRQDSVLRELGLQNGDLLRAINGLPLATPDAALDAFARLRSASQLSISIERRGQPATLEYAIQ